jgi:hypothetical protein
MYMKVQSRFLPCLWNGGGVFNSWLHCQVQGSYRFVVRFGQPIAVCELFPKVDIEPLI